MGFLNPTSPWGSPVVPGIPLPPFADDAEHRRFVRMLQTHLTLLDTGAPTLSTTALSLALDHASADADTDAGRWLTPLELATALTSWFPAPWTPSTLAETLGRVHHQPPTPHRTGWEWSYDPQFRAAPNPRGGWTVTRHERGDVDTEQLASDRDLVVLWLDHFREKFAFPLAHVRDAADTATLAPATLAVLRADERDAAHAYRATWRAERDAALTAARGLE